jgi:hypothetical protein
MKKKLAIKGDSLRKDEVIELLIGFGGEKSDEDGSDSSAYYYIGCDGKILSSRAAGKILGLKCFTLDEFISCYPIRIGGKVLYDNNIVVITNMAWLHEDVWYSFCCKGVQMVASKSSFKLYKKEECMKYRVGDKVRIKSLEWYDIAKNSSGSVQCGQKTFFKRMARFCGDSCIIKEVHDTYYKMENDSFNDEWNDDMIEGLIEKAECLTIDIPVGYEFAGVDDDRQQVFLQKIQPKYPKTYEECCEILDYEPEMHTVTGYDAELIENFQTLKLCRDAYWKLFGDWKPITDQAIVNPTTYHVHYDGFVSLFCCHPGSSGRFLLFPTEEMAERFSENFKDLINRCKELLGYHGYSKGYGERY